MKLKLIALVSTAILILSLGLISAQPPQTVPPKPKRIEPPQAKLFSMIDPNTGLPTHPGFEWKDVNWEDPAKVLTTVSYDGLPIKEVAQDLSEQFKGEFDVILPEGFGSGSSSSANSAAGGAGFFGHHPSANNEWTSLPVNLRLQNVKASEVFNAMNLLFENNRTALRWELKMNGTRRLALLRVTEDVGVKQVARKPQIKRVYYVGELIDNNRREKSMEQLVKTITEIWVLAYGQAGALQFHNGAQLLIVTGTDDEITFIQQTLEALNNKAQLERARDTEAQSSLFRARQAEKFKSPDTKTNGSGGGSSSAK